MAESNWAPGARRPDEGVSPAWPGEQARLWADDAAPTGAAGAAPTTAPTAAPTVAPGAPTAAPTAAPGPPIAQWREGEQVTGLYAVVTVDKPGTTQRGQPFLRLRLGDASAQANAVIWEVTPEQLSTCTPGAVVRTVGRVREFNGSHQLTIDKVAAVPPEQVNPTDFLPASPHDRDRQQQRLTGLIDGLANPWLQQLMRQLLADPDFHRRFLAAPAAMQIHHAWVGGLLDHVLEVTEAALGLRRLYPLYTDPDLLVVGALLHDVGKLVEIEQQALAYQYSLEGKLLGHIYLGMAWLERQIGAITGFPADLRLELLHLIATHHGEVEHGALTVPRTMNALVLHLADVASAKMNQYAQRINGESDPAAEWSPYDRRLQTEVYLGFLRRGDQGGVGSGSGAGPGEPAAG